MGLAVSNLQERNMMLTHSLTYTVALVAAGVVLVSNQPLCASETDERIEAAFSKSYACKMYLQDDAIKVESKNGVVTITGQVNEASHKYLAQETAAGLPGVQKVDNRLVVKLEGTEESDSWIRAKVRSVLALHRNVSGSKTEVDIRDGVITLRGAATSMAQKELASEYAGDVKGVLRVTNAMTVDEVSTKAVETESEKIDDASITAQVKLALLSHRSTSLISTTVGTAEGVVTVSGVAKNLAEKTLVGKLAGDIIGVRSVINNMSVAPALTQNGVVTDKAENP